MNDQGPPADLRKDIFETWPVACCLSCARWRTIWGRDDCDLSFMEWMKDIWSR